jgi:hypothetical protein
MMLLGSVAAQTLVALVQTLWTPANLAQPPAGWFDAMDASSFTTVGGFRSSYAVWTNKGYKGGQAQTTTDSGQPTRSSTSASDNNKPAILLGSNPLTIDLATNQGAFSSSMFAVARDNTGGEAIVAATGRATDATQDVRTLVIRNGTAAIDFAGGSRFQGTGASVAVPQIVGFTVQQDGAQVTSVWANGVNGGDNFRSSPTGARVTIGQMPYYTPNPPVQGLQELLLFDYLLGTTDRQKLEGYLAHRWGTTASLPSGHPFKSSAPMVTT